MYKYTKQIDSVTRLEILKTDLVKKGLLLKLRVHDQDLQDSLDDPTIDMDQLVQHPFPYLDLRGILDKEDSYTGKRVRKGLKNFVKSMGISVDNFNIQMKKTRDDKLIFHPTGEFLVRIAG